MINYLIKYTGFFLGGGVIRALISASEMNDKERPTCVEGSDMHHQ